MKKGRQGDGGGRPQKPEEEKMQKITLTFTPEQAKYLRELKNGSALVRRLLQQHIKQNSLPPSE